ncbi:Uncharacterized protein Rs2_32392 [Raphanus sativus]|nr:Uncharacterized protein Rs2_32392 [Raphanus sativus]
MHARAHHRRSSLTRELNPARTASVSHSSSGLVTTNFFVNPSSHNWDCSCGDETWFPAHSTPQPPLRRPLQAAKRSSVITPSSRDTDAISEPLFVTKSSYNLFFSAAIDHHHHVTCLKLQGSSSGLRFSNSS